MFEWVTEAADKVSDWMGGGEEQKKKAPAQGGGAAAGGGYDQQQQALSPQNNTYAQQQQAVAPVSGTVKGQGASGSTNAAGGGGGLSDWWNNLWGGGGGGGEKEKEKSGGAAPETKAAKDPVTEKREREDKYYAAKWRLDQMRGNQASYQRYIERRDKWDAAYAKYKQDPYRNKMPDQIKPFTPPNPGVPDPTYPAWGGAFAEQQAKVERLKGG